MSYGMPQVLQTMQLNSHKWNEAWVHVYRIIAVEPGTFQKYVSASTVKRQNMEVTVLIGLLT